jgi:hypothetical protein
MCGEMDSRLATAPFVSPSATSDAARSVAVRLSQPPADPGRGPRGPGRTPRARNHARTRLWRPLLVAFQCLPQQRRRLVPPPASGQ